jgi:hypothetical protein
MSSISSGQQDAYLAKIDKVIDALQSRFLA